MIFLRAFSRKWLPATFLVMLGVVACVRLGIWQLDRLDQRRAFNAHFTQMLASSPIDLPTQTDLTMMEYRAVRAKGRYDFEHQVGLRNQYYGDQYGYHLLTPLLLADGEAVLVDRGWIPAEGNSTPDEWRAYDQPGEVAVNGIIRLGQAVPAFGSVSDPALSPSETRLDFWNIVNLERIASQMPYPLLAVYIQLDDDETRTEPPIPYQPEIELTEGPHLGYALQWFTFAILLATGYLFYLRKQESRNKI